MDFRPPLHDHLEMVLTRRLGLLGTRQRGEYPTIGAGADPPAARLSPPPLSDSARARRWPGPATRRLSQSKMLSQDEQSGLPALKLFKTIPLGDFFFL